jgi:hypothetical protein
MGPLSFERGEMAVPAFFRISKTTATAGAPTTIATINQRIGESEPNLDGLSPDPRIGPVVNVRPTWNETHRAPSTTDEPVMIFGPTGAGFLTGDKLSSAGLVAVAAGEP